MVGERTPAAADAVVPEVVVVVAALCAGLAEALPPPEDLPPDLTIASIDISEPAPESERDGGGASFPLRPLALARVFGVAGEAAGPLLLFSDACVVGSSSTAWALNMQRRGRL